MKVITPKFIRAIGTMIGSIVGVGVFGLPYAYANSGLGLGLLILFVVAIIVVVMQLMYSEVVTQTDGKHRLVGYIKKYLGTHLSWFAMVALFVMLAGAMIAYIIIGGQFLHSLFSPLIGGSEAVYSVLIAIAAAALMYRGIQFAAKIEVVIISALLFLFAFIVLASAPHIQFTHLLTLNFDHTLAAYGVTLFALAGVGVVPELKDVLGKREESKLAYAAIVGMLIIVTIYASFSFVVVGVTGAATTQSAFEGLVPVLGTAFRIIGASLGALTVTSIFMLAGVQMQNTLVYDFNIKRFYAWSAVAGVPILLYLLGIREFIEIIGFTGAVFGGLLGIMIVLTYERMRKTPICKRHKCLNIPPILSWIIILVFTIGIIGEILARI